MILLEMSPIEQATVIAKNLLKSDSTISNKAALEIINYDLINTEKELIKILYDKEIFDLIPQ